MAYGLGRGQGDYMAVRYEMYNEIVRHPDWYRNVIHKLHGALARIMVDSPAPCPKAHWMSMPSMGEVMANAFERPVFFFSTTFCQTCLPSFCPPNSNPPIFIAFLYEFSHFVPLQLHNPRLFPAPQLMKGWKEKASEEAWGWEAIFSDCFQLTVERKIENPMKHY